MNRREEMMQLLGRRERQGLTFKALAQESGVPAGTLAFWAWKLRQEPRPREPAADQRSGFVELVPRPEGNRHGTPAAGEPGARSAVLPLTARCATYSRSFPTSCWST